MAEQAFADAPDSASDPRARLAVPEDLLFWALRCTIGRMTYAVGLVVDALIANADQISEHTRREIVDEITRAEKRGKLGVPQDAADWLRVRAAMLPTPDVAQSRFRHTGRTRLRPTEPIEPQHQSPQR